jgi:hypothetical protein
MKDPRRRRVRPAVTIASRSNCREPRLPHERDESAADAHALRRTARAPQKSR